MTDDGDNGEVMGLVVRLVIQARRSEQGNVIVLRHLMEVKDASDLIARKQHATLKDVQLTGNGDHGEVMVLVVRLVIQAKRSEQGNVIVLRPLVEVKNASDLIAGKKHATLKDVHVTCCHILLYFNISFLNNTLYLKI